jgi:hypothetical protein
MQCGIGNCVNAQVKIIRMNAMNGYGGTKSHIQERVCVNVCACVHVCMRKERKGMTVNMNISETKFPRQWRSSEQSKDISAAVTNNRMYESDSNMRDSNR